MRDHEQSHVGGCLCGAVRFRVSGPPAWVAHCHCQSCRRASGAAFLTWAGYTGETWRLTQGDPVRFESSPGAWRRFCPACGTPLTYEGAYCPGEIHVTIGSLDEPGDFTPSAHVFTEEQIAWLHIADDLPRHARLGRDSEAD